MHARYRVHDTQSHVSTHMRRASTTINPRYSIIDKTSGETVDAFTTRSTASHICASMNREHRLEQLRTDDVAAVLDAVRASGKSAHAVNGERVSALVMSVAIERELNPVALQHDVDEYASALDAL